MDNTNEFVEKLNQKQAKAEQNEKRQGKAHASRKLPNKQH
ncbi:DUF4023 domain-containing protein [Priestia flexa]|nr:DUF4023 domain-containing protein [Priestia flexa]MDT2046522.1 DUF4023 domain-containing protein [Priestia flexa]